MISYFKKVKRRNLLIILISISLFIYVLLRALKLDFTYDESFTYLYYVKTSLIHSFIYLNPNNHLLNTMLMKLTSHLFGNSELSLRLPNVISYLFFLFFSFKILNRITPRLVLLGFILLNFNPYLIQYFSIARGYALSISFITASIYFLISFIDKKQDKELFLTALFGVLSVLSNLTSVNYYISLFLILLVVIFTDRFKKEGRLDLGFAIRAVFSKKIFIILLVSLVGFLLMIIPVILMKLRNQFYFGGNIGFVQDTIGSLIKDTLYFSSFSEFIYNLILIIVLISIVLGIIVFIKRYIRDDGKEKFIFIVFYLSIISSIIQNSLLHTKYLIDRTALFFIPLYILTVILTINFLLEITEKMFIKKIKISSILITISYLVSILFIFNLFNNLNLNKTLEWEFNAKVKESFYDQIFKVKEKDIIYVENYNYPSMEYYNSINGEKLNLSVIPITYQ